MNKRKKRVRKGKKISIWLKIPVVLIVIIVLSFVGVKNKLYLKSVLQKYPVIFKVLQKGENVVSDLWAKVRIAVGRAVVREHRKGEVLIHQ